MNLESAVEGLAKALGVWWEAGWDGHDGPLAVAIDGGSAWVRVGGPGFDVRALPSEVAFGDAAILLSAKALGVTLELSCPACARRSGRWEWKYSDGAGEDNALPTHGWVRDNHPHFHYIGFASRRPMVRPCPECAVPGPDVECEVCEGLGALAFTNEERKPWPLAGRHLRDGESSPDTITHCARCNHTGRVPGPSLPTGKVTRSPERWVLDAMPRPVVISNVAEHWGGVGQAMAKARNKDLGHTPGDQPTREALGVLADKLQERGETFGEMLGAWLAGECRVCEGGRLGDGATYDGGGGFVDMEYEDCRKCHGLGTVLGAYAPQLEEFIELQYILTASKFTPAERSERGLSSTPTVRQSAKLAEFRLHERITH